jgi:hypothetical protein
LDSGSTISAILINGNLFQKSEFVSLPLKTSKVAQIIGIGTDGATYPIQGQTLLVANIDIVC